MTRRTIALLAVPVAAVGLGGTTALAGGASQARAKHRVRHTTLKLTADPNGSLKFNTKTLSAKHGKVTIKMTNPASSGLQHGVGLSGKNVNKVGKIVNAGKGTSITLTLPAGTYTYFCPVAGHEAAGMKGRLTIR